MTKSGTRVAKTRQARRSTLQPLRITERSSRATANRTLWAPLFDLRPGDETSLQQQIRRTLVAVILDDTLSPGTRLPSSRALARCLGVSRNTVVLAYRELADEEWIATEPRRGYFVRHGAPPAPAMTDTDGATQSPANEMKVAYKRPESSPDVSLSAPRWRERLHGHYAVQRNIQKPAQWYQYPYPFIYGQPDPALFPVAEWRECSRAALAVLAIRDWSADLIDGDDAMLIDYVRRRILPRRGIFAAPDEIMITVGTQNALYMLAQLLTGRHSIVGVEDPGYPDGRNILATRGAGIRALPLPIASPENTEALRGCDVLYLTPSHQCPTSVTMTVSDRQSLLDVASRHDLLIIEDDYESELAVHADPLPALKSTDRSDRVIYLGSLSKCLAPGLRIGYLVGARELITEARALRRLMLRHPPANNQRASATFIALGHYDALIRRLASVLGERRSLLTRALSRYAPQLRFVLPSGGSSLWITGPPELDSRRLAEAAKRVGVLIEPGDVFFASPPRPCPFFRLGYASIQAERIDGGIRRLSKLIGQADSEDGVIR